MTLETRKSRYLLWMLLLYGLLIGVLNLNYNSVHVDEAFHITIGHQLLSGKSCPGCPYATGSVLIHPVVAALGDSIGGLYGARAMNILFGLGLTLIIYRTTRILFDGKYGLIAATLFLFTGTTLYLSKLATYDIVAAFFLGLSFLLILLSEKAPSALHKDLWLSAGAAALFFAAITKYLVPVFIPLLFLYVLWRHRISRALFFFLFPLAVFLLLYAYFALYPAKNEIMGVVMGKYTQTQIPLTTLASWTFRWVALPCLLATFGMFHEERGKTAILLFVLSTPIIILHLLTGAEQAVNKNVIFSIVFLSPAAALGVNHIGTLFSMKSTSPWVKSFFIIAVLVVVWAYGLHNLRWLEKQYPDISPVFEFFKEKGFDDMTVGMNYYGDVMFIYSLNSYYPHARYLHITQVDKTDNPGPKADFMVCDTFYGVNHPCEEALKYLGNGYILLKDLKIPLSWGSTDVKIFGRR